MPNHTDTSPENDPSPNDDAVQAEVLIGRIIDLEATDEDQLRFEQLATSDPTLWRTLAGRQLDMAVLTQRVTEETAGVNRVELPVIAPVRGVRWTLAYSGWAAVLVIAAIWAILPSGSSNPVLQQTADEALDVYTEAPFVLEEFDPILMDWERIDDEWIRLFIMRRFQEEIVTRRPIEELRGENDKLTIPPAELRKESPPPPVSNDQ